MPDQPSFRESFRFDSFEFDPVTGELRKRGIPVRLQPQMARVLQLLVENPERLITQDELREQVWTGIAYGDFDHSLHNVMARLRETLGDSAQTPRYIETLPRRGYRIIARLERKQEISGEPNVVSGQAEPVSALTSKIRLLAALVLAIVFASMAAFWGGHECTAALSTKLLRSRFCRSRTSPRIHHRITSPTA